MPRQSSAIRDTPEIKLPPKDEANKTRAELRQDALDGVLQLGQFACLAFGQFSDAGAIGMHGRPITNELVKLAENNSKVASKVDLLIEVGPYAGIVAAAIPFLAQLFVNHGVFKAEQFANAGVVSPQTLEAEMKTEMLRQAMDAMHKQKVAEEEMRRMQDEMLDNLNGDSNSE